MNYENILLVALVLVIVFLFLNYHHLQEKFTETKYQRRIKPITTEYIGIDPKLRSEAMIAISLVLKQINERTKLLYILNRIDQITVESTPCGARHYICDVFAHELHYKITRRLLFDFIIKRDKTIIIQSMNISNAFKYADSADGVNPADPIPELILKDWNLGNDYHIEGNTPDGSIPYSLFEGSHTKESPLPDKFRNWILPLAIQQGTTISTISHTHSNSWDINGIPLNTCDCNFTKTKYPIYNPTVSMSLTDVGDNSWQFDKSRGVMGNYPIAA